MIIFSDGMWTKYHFFDDHIFRWYVNQVPFIWRLYFQMECESSTIYLMIIFSDGMWTKYHFFDDYIFRWYVNPVPII